ncbi:hypothetical protein ACFX19_046210 [Malus domestica]
MQFLDLNDVHRIMIFTQKPLSCSDFAQVTLTNVSPATVEAFNLNSARLGLLPTPEVAQTRTHFGLPGITSQPRRFTTARLISTCCPPPISLQHRLLRRVISSTTTTNPLCSLAFFRLCQ